MGIKMNFLPSNYASAVKSPFLFSLWSSVSSEKTVIAIALFALAAIAALYFACSYYINQRKVVLKKPEDAADLPETIDGMHEPKKAADVDLLKERHPVLFPKKDEVIPENLKPSKQLKRQNFFSPQTITRTNH